MSAAAYGSTLATGLLLRSEQILTCLAASVHVTYDRSTDLRADESRRVTTERKVKLLKETAFSFSAPAARSDLKL